MSDDERSIAEIEADLERDRQALQANIAELKDRLSPGGIAREALGAFDTAKPGAVALGALGSVGGAIRSNPIATLIVGAGETARILLTDMQRDQERRYHPVGLVDDEAFAEMFVRSRQETKGLAAGALRHELRTKGVPDEVVDAALEEIDPEREKEQARALVARRLRTMRGLDRDTQTRRLAGFLAAHPTVEMSLQSTVDVVDFTREPEIDAALRIGLGEWPGTVAEHLFDE